MRGPPFFAAELHDRNADSEHQSQHFQGDACYRARTDVPGIFQEGNVFSEERRTEEDESEDRNQRFENGSRSRDDAPPRSELSAHSTMTRAPPRIAIQQEHVWRRHR